MKITVLDTETTGLDQEKGHRLIEVCFQTYDLASQKLISGYTQRINPERSISKDAQAIHGIDITDLRNEPVWEDVAPKVQKIMADSDLLVAHNAGFDMPFIGMELIRLKLAVPNVPSFCTMENGRWATPLGKLPSLKELCFALGFEYAEAAAHAADYDVDRTAKCLFAGIERGFYVIDDQEQESAA